MTSSAMSRWLALVFAIVLGVAEALLNQSRPDGKWQYAPLWIIDYVIVAALLAGFWLNRRRGHEPVLIMAWALAAGVFYLALFASLDPDLAQNQPPDDPGRNLFLTLVGSSLAVQVLGLALALHGYYRRLRMA
jgi:RsiW-degrading membrane proteinase PrsW (M82 family)